MFGIARLVPALLTKVVRKLEALMPISVVNASNVLPRSQITLQPALPARCLA